MLRKVIYIVTLLLGIASLPLQAQVNSSQDSLVRLISAKSVRQIEERGMHYRIVLGPAIFLHNNTYLQCDSASWNVDLDVIEAFENVKIIQDKTMLESDKLTYYISTSIANFRGDLVELSDKDGNRLRTNALDYNTKDSVATYKFGAAMKDKDGNVIESRTGTYDAKLSSFMFENNVQMFADSAEIRTTSLNYVTNEQKAYFGRRTYMWRGGGFLSSDAGWFDRGNNVMHFSDNAYVNDKDYEAWADEIYYYRDSGLVQMFHNVQVLDTANTAILLAHRAEYYRDSLWATLTNSPAVIYYGENENHEPDSAFVAADTVYCYKVKKCDIPNEEIEAAVSRKKDAEFDALAELRKKQAEEREKQALEKKKKAGLLPPEVPDSAAPADSLNAHSDSLGVVPPPDSTAVRDLKVGRDSSAVQEGVAAMGGIALTDSSAVALADSSAVALTDSTAVAPADSTAVPRDTTLIMHLKAFHNVKMYRSDVQAVCDSVVFTELDSIVRMYGKPALWNAIKNQLTAESMQLLLKDGELYRGSMLKDAMIITKEDTTHFNQIKSTEMMGFFKDNQLNRYDALGNVTAVFYIVEEEAITTINMKEAKSLTAVIKDGNAQKMLYLEGVKSDAYPVGELPVEKQRLKGFVWRGDERPVDRFAVTQRILKPTQRDRFVGLSKPDFRTVNQYFDNYMNPSFREVEE